MQEQRREKPKPLGQRQLATTSWAQRRAVPEQKKLQRPRRLGRTLSVQTHSQGETGRQGCSPGPELVGSTGYTPPSTGGAVEHQASLVWMSGRASMTCVLAVACRFSFFSEMNSQWWRMLAGLAAREASQAEVIVCKRKGSGKGLC